ncbi:MAG: hypothetical protein AB1348_09470 [Nitrospirota bacterium]
MFVAKYSKWIAQIIFKDDTYAVFDGASDGRHLISLR